MTGLLLRIFVPFAAGYFLSYLFRSINAVIATRLMDELALSASDIGVITAAYLLAFAAFQVPLGILLDSFGPRRVHAALVALCSLGALIFALSESVATLTLGRALIGLGMAGALMSAFATFVLWFPANRLPTLNGCFLAFGGLGALAATTPVEIAIELVPWRTVFLALAAVTLAVAVAIYVLVPEAGRRHGRTPPSLAEQLRGLRGIATSGLFWALAPLTMACLGSAFAIQGLWAGPWFESVVGLSSRAAASHLMLIAIGLTVGSLGSGAIVAMLRRLFGGTVLLAFGVGGFGFILVQLMIVAWPWLAPGLLWLAFGFFINQTALSYAALSQRFPGTLAGRVNTCLNMLVVGTAFVLQAAIGWLVDLVLSLTSAAHVSLALRVSFASVLAVQVAALLWFLMACPRTLKRAAEIEGRVS